MKLWDGLCADCNYNFDLIESDTYSIHQSYLLYLKLNIDKFHIYPIHTLVSNTDCFDDLYTNRLKCRCLKLCKLMS